MHWPALRSLTVGAAASSRNRQQLSEGRDAACDVLASGTGTDAEAEAGPAGALQQALRAAELVDERCAFLEALPDPAKHCKPGRHADPARRQHRQRSRASGHRRPR